MNKDIRARLKESLIVLLPTIAMTLPLSGVAGAQAAAQPEAARMLVQQAAEALGGAQRLRDVRNITMAGYGQYVWLVGGEDISSSPHVPQKYQAANDLRRVYDLENDRFQASERRFALFPFLDESYQFPLTDQRLDGDIAWDPSSKNMFFNPPGPDHPRRVAAHNGGVGPNGPDGVDVRRIWMVTNPVVLVRALMDPATTLSAPHREGEYQVLDIKLKQGIKLSAGFFTPGRFCQGVCAHLPAFLRWSAPDVALGESFFTTWFTGYASYEGLMFPLGYDTHADWHDVDYFKVYVDHYEVNGQIPDLAAPSEIRNAPLPGDLPDFMMRPVSAEKVADHIWRISPAGTTVVEFQDHLTLFELDAPPALAKAIIDYARTLVPGKPVTQLICTHEHFDHITGMRTAVAQGITIISRRPNGLQFEQMVNHPDPDYPDDLTRSHQKLKFIPVDEKLVLSDPTMTLWVLWTRNNIHMADGVLAYAPAQKVIMEGDVATAAYKLAFWPDNLRDIIDYYHLDVEKDSPVHSVDPEHRGVLTMQQVDELEKGATARARKLCADFLAKDYYLAGCPVWSKRY